MAKVTIEFSPEAYQELEKLKDELKEVSVEEVILDALTYLRFCREEVKAGNKIVILTQQEEIRPIRLSFLD